MNLYTYMWRESPTIPNDKIFRFQTNDPHINRKMRKRKDFKLVMIGMNRKMWGYKTIKYGLKEAKRTLRRITGQNIFYDENNELFYANIGAIVAPKYIHEAA